MQTLVCGEDVELAARAETTEARRHAIAAAAELARTVTDTDLRHPGTQALLPQERKVDPAKLAAITSALYSNKPGR